MRATVDMHSRHTLAVPFFVESRFLLYYYCLADAECCLTCIVLLVPRLDKDSHLTDFARKLALDIGKQVTSKSLSISLQRIRRHSYHLKLANR